MYSLCVSYANDFLSPKQMISAAGTLIFACGLGMIAGPPIASIRKNSVILRKLIEFWFNPTVDKAYVRIGDFANVRIVSADHFDLYGVVVE